MKQWGTCLFLASCVSLGLTATVQVHNNEAELAATITGVDQSTSSPVASVAAVAPFQPVSDIHILDTELNRADGSGIKKMERSIRIEGDSFMLDGKPIRFVAGSLHYFRVPAQYWPDRLAKLRAAGLNAVSTYVEWSFHETEERQYDWQGDRDLVRFIQLAAEAGLLVLLRPGPYICAERDLGGLPYWLLSKYPKINLRTTDKNYMAEVTTWMSVLFEKMEPLLYGNGGPIVMVQVENEYGSYACEAAYMTQLRDLLRGHVRDHALLYTTDGTLPSMIRCGRVNDTLTTIDFGVGTNPEAAFATLRKFMPHGPLMNSEFYPGWLTHWGESFQRVSTDRVVKSLRDILNTNASVNIYVFYGGSNFEFTAGANYNGAYQPDITSYDYDAPLTEAGDPTPKYDAIKALLEQYYPEVRALPRAEASVKGAYGVVPLSARLGLLSGAGRATLGTRHARAQGAALPTYEALRQRAGLMLYETNVPAGAGDIRLLHVAEPRDRIYVYVDNEFAGLLSRMHHLYSLPLNAQENATLSLLVESQGRINYGNMLHDFKGILGDVKLDGQTLAGEWSVLGFPLENLNIPANTTVEQDQKLLKSGPVLYEGSFVLPAGDTPKDTFLDPTGWEKGYVWVNGHNLGRYWPSTGPQVTIYVPGVYLLAAPEQNLVQLLELETSPQDPSISFIDHPVLGNQLS